MPYNLLTYLAKVAPKGKERDYIIQKLQEYGYLAKNQEPDSNLLKRIDYALNWVKDYAEEIKETAIELSEKKEKAVKELIKLLEKEETAEKIQNAIFQIARKHEIKPPNFFKTLYMILLGVPKGPRLGPYIVTMGRENVIRTLKKAVKEGLGEKQR